MWGAELISRIGRHFVAIATVGCGAVLAGVGCGSEQPTSVTINVRTDLACDDLRSVAIAVGGPDVMDTRPPQTVTPSCAPFDEELSAVGTLVVVPNGANDAELAIRVVAGVGRNADRCTSETGFRGCVVARRLVQFVPGREIELFVDLRLECSDVGCDPRTTCVKRSCVDASVDGNRCLDAPCGEDLLGVTPPRTDGGSIDSSAVPPNGICPDGEKRCGEACVKRADPAFGCTPSSCAPCAGSDATIFQCVEQRCVRSACAEGFKLCGDSCVPSDAAHGCGNAACTPCESTNGTAGCDKGACTLQCAAGYKSCGGRCVLVDDPTYGCTATECTATGCPAEGGGTLICQAGACVVGACPANTKICNQRCVPIDANNGCAETSRCTPCATSELCLGTPTKCQCQPESVAVTCASKVCGPATNNCGQIIQCPDTCASHFGASYTCGGGAAGPNGCGCTPNDAVVCQGVECGPAINNCGQPIQCPDTCAAKGSTWACNTSGVGPNTCGCTPLTKSAACDGRRCGSASNGCGSNYNCGSCLSGQVCKCEYRCMSSGSICP